ncbi:MAG: phenylalanine 4-monooxygenase [Marinilabiliales bacterium]|nr:MAG: phenylalanine 4-monooxygenase [Marinilabiliales bacterium]
MFDNPIIQQLPKHLHVYIVEQNYDKYTPRDQAVWRYVMKRNMDYLSKVAHSSYVEGLSKTGISVDHIPSIDEMNECLGKIGWAAATVDGFIPPLAFMEFQKHKVLVIAADIRSLSQIEYTPAPDIIHEAAGHAPIIADPEYAEYLRYFGEVGSKAFSSKNDHKIYEAIRHLSILKANPYSSEEDIQKAEEQIEELNNNGGIPSEMTLIRNLHWWTVEYGLVGSLDKPAIYGAGLLSSIGESKNALKYHVKKIPYTKDAMDYGFDITQQQPQLFVTPDFKHLTEVLDEFAGQMAFRTGGLDGLMKAIESGNTATLEYSSGIQVSGTLTDVLIAEGRPIYINTTGHTTLNYNNKMLIGEGKENHPDGFGSPIGKIKGSLKPTRFLTDIELGNLGIKKGKSCTFEFESGIIVKGVLSRVVRQDDKIILMTFYDCTVKHNRKTLFEPSWGHYDMAVGESITSVFAGPADADSFCHAHESPTEKTIQINYDENSLKLFKLYKKINDFSEEKNNYEHFQSIYDEYIDLKSNDWLLLTELLWALDSIEDSSKLKEKVTSRLNELKTDNKDLSNLIDFGLNYKN